MKHRILVVEDEFITAKHIELTLQQLGYDVIATVTSGEKALDMIAAMPPNLVLMDISLSGELDGIETAQQIRSKFDVPVVYLSAYTNQEVLERAKISAPYAYIVKPFKERELQTNIDIALYKHAAERKLQASEKRYRTIVELQSDAVCRWTPDFTLTFVNDAYCRLYGQSADELLGQSRLSLQPDEAQERLRSIYTILAETPQIYAFEQCLITPDGQRRWLHWIDCPILDEQGQVVEFQSVGRDMTERKRSEEALQQRTEELRERVKELNCLYTLAKLVEQPGITVEKIFQGTVDSIQSAWQYPEQTWVRLRFQAQEFCTANFRETAWRQTSDISVHQQQCGTLEVYVVQAPGESHAATFLPEEATLLDTIAEALGKTLERLEAEERIRYANERYQLLFQVMPAAMFTVDLEQRITSWNRTAEEITGYAAEEVLGKTCGHFMLEPCCSQCGLYEAGLSKPIWGRECRIRTSSGTIRTITKNSEIIRNAAGKIIGGIESFIDVTERKQMEDALAQANDELERRVQQRTAELSCSNTRLQQEIQERQQVQIALQRAKESAEFANRAKSEFLANMSHEFRTPLNAILGYAQILKNSDNLNERQQEGLDTIKNSGEHLLNLINEILDLSKIEAGHMELHPAEFNFLEFLKHIAKIIRIRAEQKGIDFHCEIDPTIPIGVHADEKRLREILINLLGNAVKFTKHGHVTFQVIRCDQHAPPHLRFQVEDTGIGIAFEKLDDIFLPFQQAGDGLATEGTGLGLPISAKLVEMMGGLLNVKSIVGEGSMFWFEIELPEAPEIILNTIAHGQKIVGYHGPRRTVLVVDDEPENRAVLVGMLLLLDFHVIEAENGQECLEKALTCAPDVILLDLRMPLLDGFGATQRIREAERTQDFNGSANTPPVTIIAVSANVFQETRERAFRVGFNDFLIKPFQLDSLLKLLQKHLHLDWIYEDLRDSVPADLLQIDQERLAEAPLPAPIIKELTQFARLGNAKRLLAVIHGIEKLDPRYLPWINVLRTLTKKYQFERIVELLDL